MIRMNLWKKQSSPHDTSTGTVARGQICNRDTWDSQSARSPACLGNIFFFFLLRWWTSEVDFGGGLLADGCEITDADDTDWRRWLNDIYIRFSSAGLTRGPRCWCVGTNNCLRVCRINERNTYLLSPLIFDVAFVRPRFKMDMQMDREAMKNARPFRV